MTTSQIPGKAESQRGIRPSEYRLAETTHLGRVRLQVANLDRSVAFYEKILGMRVIRREVDAVSLGAHGDDREIVPLRQLKGARPVPRRGLLDYITLRFCCPICIAPAGVRRAPRTRGNVGMLIAAERSDYLSDPDGLGIEVHAIALATPGVTTSGSCT
jgi:catechol 2,3-dioxygenase